MAKYDWEHLEQQDIIDYNLNDDEIAYWTIHFNVKKMVEYLNKDSKIKRDWWCVSYFVQDRIILVAEHNDYGVKIFFEFEKDGGFCDAIRRFMATYETNTLGSWYYSKCDIDYSFNMIKDILINYDKKFMESKKQNETMKEYTFDEWLSIGDKDYISRIIRDYSINAEKLFNDISSDYKNKKMDVNEFIDLLCTYGTKNGKIRGYFRDLHGYFKNWSKLESKKENKTMKKSIRERLYDDKKAIDKIMKWCNDHKLLATISGNVVDVYDDIVGENKITIEYESVNQVISEIKSHFGIKESDLKSEMISFLNANDIKYTNIKLAKHGEEIWIYGNGGQIVITEWEWNRNEHDKEYADFIAYAVMNDNEIDNFYESKKVLTKSNKKNLKERQFTGNEIVLQFDKNGDCLGFDFESLQNCLENYGFDSLAMLEIAMKKLNNIVKDLNILDYMA